MIAKASIAALLSVVILAGTASAATPNVRKAGVCDGSSRSAVVVTQYNATTLKVRFVISRSTPGQTWQLFGSDNGLRIFAINRVVNAAGTAAVSRLVKDRPGTDTIKATGLNLTTGETCSVSMAY